jgi:hypothetical protein
VHDVGRPALGVAQLVRGVQARERVAHHAQRDARVDTAALCHGLEEPGQRVALDVLHHQVHRAAVLSDVEDRHDVRVSDPHREPRLFDEVALELDAPHVRVHELDRDLALELERVVHARQVHGAHAAAGDRHEQLVTPDTFGEGRKGGRGRGPHARRLPCSALEGATIICAGRGCRPAFSGGRPRSRSMLKLA